MTITICDVCGKELKEDYHSGIFFKDDEILKAEVKMDFCRNCYRTLTAIIEKNRKPKVDASDMELKITDEREEPKQSIAERLVKAKPKVKVEEEDDLEIEDDKKRFVDHGKIIALYKAGWRIKDIADDVKCSPATVTYHIKKFKEEEK